MENQTHSSHNSTVAIEVQSIANTLTEPIETVTVTLAEPESYVIPAGKAKASLTIDQVATVPNIFVQAQNNPVDGIDVGTWATPTLIDFEGMATSTCLSAMKPVRLRI